MAGEDVQISVGVDVGGAVSSFREIEKAANDIKYSTKDLKNIQIGLKSAGIKADLADIKEGIDSVVDAEKRALTKNYAEAAIKGGIAARKADLKAREDQDRTYNQYLDDERKGLERNAANERKVIAENNAIMNKYDNERAARAQKRADEEEKLIQIRAAREVDSAQYINQARNKQEEQTRQAELTSFRSAILGRAEQTRANEEFINTLPRLRYALYDVAAVAQNVSQSFIQFGVDVISTAASYETAFTSVQRVTDLTEKQTVALRDSLKDLATQIPLSFQDLSGITTLGAQLGISEDRLIGFTETVSKFSSVANVSNEETAKSFGALSELLNFSQADFEKFGSSVAYAGKEAVATESEILSVATQIGGVAGAAGFSAESVVGLATALASLRIPAEQSRGAMTRFLQETNRAVAENGPQLQMFAQVVGLSVEETSNLAKTDMSGFFNRFVQGLQGMDPQSLTLALDALGLADQRVTNTLTRLASNFNVVEQSQANASKGFQDGTFLTEAFGQKADDLASKFQFLQSAIANLGDTIGQAFSPQIGAVVDGLTTMIIGFEEFTKSADGRAFIQIAGFVAVLTAVIAGLVTAIALAGAGSAAFVTVLSTLKAAQFVAFFTGLITSFTGVTVSAGVATAALTAFRIALLLSGVGIALAVVGGVAAAMAGTAKQSKLAADGTSNWAKTVSAAEAKSGALKASASGVNKEFSDMGSGPGGGTAGSAAAKIRTLTDYANDLSSVFSRSFELRFSSSNALDAISKSFSSIAKSTSDARDEIKSLNADISSLTADKALQEYFLSVAEAYGDTLRAQKIRSNLAKIDLDLTKKTDALGKAQGKANATLIGNSDAAVENRSQILGLVSNYQSYIRALASSGASQEQLAAANAKAKADFIAQATQLGYNQNELGLYAAAFDDVTFAINNIPRNITVGFDIDSDPAVTALAEILAAAQSTAGGIGDAFSNAGDAIAAALQAEKDARIQANLYEEDIKALGETFQKFPMPTYAFPNNPQNRLKYVYPTGMGNDVRYQASGGPIYGAGTSRSDSIPAMLSNGEYVIQASAVKQYGVGFFNQLNQMKTPRFFSGGGSISAPSNSSNVVALSAGSIQAIAHAVQPMLFLDGQKISDASSAAYSNNTKVGAF